MRNRLVVGLLALVCLLAIPVCAQIDTGIISGRVTDSTGAVVPGAKLTITETETNTSSASQTNDEGLYRVPSLRSGTYKVAVTAAGFKAFTRAGLTLRIGENLGVDVTLEVGAVTESVDVTGALPLLETQTSSTGQVMEGQYLYELPNYQHWEVGALFFTPQVQQTNQAWPGSLGNWSINGGNSNQIGYFEDGQVGTNVNIATGGGTIIYSISAAVDEVRVLSSVLPAEYGHATSGAISVTKSAGTNTFHGQGGELFKNDPMVHRRFFDKQTVQQQGITALFQQPDFVVAGPVWIPKIYNGRNRTFFEVAGSYHVDTNANADQYAVPTADMLNGIFQFPGVATNVIYDPNSTSGSFAAGNLSRTPFPNNTIPANRMSSMWKAIMAVNSGAGPFAKPNAAGSYTGSGVTNNLILSGHGKYFGLGTQFRIDQNIGQKLRFFVSYIWNNNHQPSVNNPIIYAPFDADQNYTITLQKLPKLGVTYTFSPTLISETRIGAYWQSNNPFMADSSYQFAIAKTVPNLASNVYLNPIGTGFTEGKYGSSNLGTGTLGIAVNSNHQFNQDFTKVWRDHAFKFGYEWLWMNYNSHNIGNPRLSLTFGGTGGLQGNGVSIPNTGGITLANLELGYVTGYSYAQQGASLLPVDSIHSFYFQDDWRIHPRLTLNLGLRYSSESPAHSKFPGGLSEASLTIPDDVYPASIPNVVTCPASGCMGGYIQPKGGLYNRDNDNFQPRIGLAWTVTPNTVVRGGFSLMTQDMGLWQTNQNEIGGGSFLQQNVTTPNNVYTPLFQIDSGVPAPVWPKLRANGTLPSTASAGSGAQNRSNSSLTIIPANIQNPYTLNWNLSIQRAFKKNYMVQVSYVGSHNVKGIAGYNWESRPYGTGLDANGNVIDLTQPANAAYRSTWVQNTTSTQAYKPFPNWNGVTWDTNGTSMIYHSGTVQIEKRYSGGLTLLAFLTYQKGLQNNIGNLYVPQTVGRFVTSTTNKLRLTTSGTYELPFGRGKRFMNHGRLMDYLFGGYSLAVQYSQWTPQPASTGYTNAQYVNPVTGVLGGRQDYPNYEPSGLGSNLIRIQDPTMRDNWQDIGGDRFVQANQNSMITNCGTAIPNVGNNCVHVAPSFTNGNMPANMWTPERIIAFSMSAYKDFAIKERYKAQVRLDFFNPFKWYNLTGLSTTMDQTNQKLFGTVTGDFADSTQGGPPEMQLGLRINF